MVDQVEISNVGGGGVASEATLLALLNTVRSSRGSLVGGVGATNDQTAIRLQQAYQRSQKTQVSQTKEYNTALKSTIDGALRLGKEFAAGGDRVSDFSNAVFGGQSIISKFVGYIDNSLDSFRSLASVGASFNNNMFDFMLVSADAAMSLESFVGFVKSNSNELAKLGGTVSQGASNFANLSRQFRLGIGSTFFEMGMTIEDVNDGLLGYLALENRRGNLLRLNDKQQQSAAADYILQLDKLTKLTGLQRSALIETQLALQTDAKVRGQITRLEQSGNGDRARELEAIYTLQKTTLPGFHDALIDLSDGVAQSPIAQALRNAIPGIDDFAVAVASGNVSQDEYVRQMQKFGPQLVNYANNLDGATLDAYRAAGGFYAEIANLADNAYQFSEIMQLNTEAAKEQQKDRDAFTSTIGKFQQAIQESRAALFRLFVRSPFAIAIGELGTKILALISPTGGLGIFESFFDTLFGEQGYLTKGVRSLTEFLDPNNPDGLESVLNSFSDALESVFKFIQEFLKDVTTEGFGTAISNAFNKLFGLVTGTDPATDSGGGADSAPATGPGFFEGIFDQLRETLTTAFDYILTRFSEVFGLVTGTDPATDSGGGADSAPATGPGFFEGIFDQLRETLTTAFDDILTKFGNVFDKLMTRVSDHITVALGNVTWPTLMGGGSMVSQEALDAATARLANPFSFANGSDGFREFGAGTPAILHGTEAVVPRNSAAGQMLASSGLSGTPGTANTYNNTTNSGILDGLNRLNNTMRSVESLLQQGNNIQKRTQRNTAGLGNDMFVGVPT